MTANVVDVKYVKKHDFSNHDILSTNKKLFLCSLRIKIELRSEKQYFGIMNLASREFDIEAYSDRMEKEFPKKPQWVIAMNYV